MEPQALRWEDLQYSVGRRDGGSKLLLSSGVSGVARTGRTFAIMGPSGAGKTTLLSILAGDPSTCAKGKTSGRITLDGRPRQASSFREQSCLVRQADVLLATSTVRETLMFHALLQLPRDMSKKAKAQRVEQVLGLLGLVSCGDTMIGDSQAGIKGISGGERRRLALGVELIKEPTIIFIDEPTTGLDSETALQVMQYVASLARDHGRMVIFNIHQPNGDIAELFDDLLLLAPGGRAVYSGDSRGAIGMFSSLGHDLPQFKAPCDFYMALLANEQTVSQLADAWAVRAVGAGDAGGLGGDAGVWLPTVRTSVGGAAGRRQVKDVENGSVTPSSSDGDNSPVAARFEVVLASHGSSAAKDSNSKDGQQGKGSPRGAFNINSPRWRGKGSSSPHAHTGSRLALTAGSASCEGPSGLGSAPSGISAFKGPVAVRRQRPSWFFEVWVLSQRSWRWWLRNPAMLLSEFAQYLLVCLIMGSIYWQVRGRLPAGAYDRMGGLFAIVATIMATAPSRALMAWDKERRLLKWELSNNAYRLSSFVVSKMLVSLPVEAAQVFIVSTVYYLMMGLSRTSGQYWTSMSILALLAANADIIGHLVAVLTPDISVAFPVLSVMMTLVLAFCGFVVQDIPVYWGWIQKVSCCSYAFAALVLNEFQGLNLLLPGDSKASAPALNFVPASIGVDRFPTVAGFVLVLLGITGVTLTLAIVLTLLVVKFKLMGF